MSPEQKLQVIEKLDLSSIQERLQRKDKFAPARAERTIKMYREFLAMILVNPDQIMVPNEDVDAAWHHHILDTVRYQKDCQDLFGKFLHHNPSFFGTDAFFEACDQTKNIHENMFKETGPFLADKKEASSKPAWCGGMLKDDSQQNLKAGWCGGMLQENPEQNLKPGWCGGMLKDDSQQNLKPGWCGGMLQENPEQNANPAWCGGMLKDEPQQDMKPAWCGGMLKDDTEETAKL